ncbi:MAG: restriction endonuclease subunit M [Oscillospiraceae bacterium]|nr:restriction endonuclease subunit M [Oscillospiraceae bacterium]
MQNVYENTMALIPEAPIDILISMPRILDILLLDRTTSTPNTPRNIIWANDNYIEFGASAYAATAQIKPKFITGAHSTLIMPRALKTASMKKERTRTKAEVFTPTWIVKTQNDAVDENYLDDDLETYTRRKWLEITCGEAPYMATRYDMESGEIVPLPDRVGFIDRKLARINNEIADKAEWQRLVELAYKSSYGFEWNGDSLLIARENLLYTYRDYYFAKWGDDPLIGLIEEIAKIISYNVFQMDGIKYIIPLTEKREKIVEMQLSLFDVGEPKDEWKITPGKRARVMNWDTNRMEYFDKM